MPASVASGNFGVGSWIERRARIAPDAVALIAADRSFTYAELAVRVRRLGDVLRRLGVARGDRPGWGRTTPRSWNRSSPPACSGLRWLR